MCVCVCVGGDHICVFCHGSPEVCVKFIRLLFLYKPLCSLCSWMERGGGSGLEIIMQLGIRLIQVKKNHFKLVILDFTKSLKCQRNIMSNNSRRSVGHVRKMPALAKLSQ